jgi:hypothetical protein
MLGVSLFFASYALICTIFVSRLGRSDEKQVP